MSLARLEQPGTADALWVWRARVRSGPPPELLSETFAVGGPDPPSRRDLELGRAVGP